MFEETGSQYHIPVLFYECLDNLVLNPKGIYVDCTLGGGGHSDGIAQRLEEGGKLIAIDQDEQAIAFASERLKKHGKKVEIYKDNFVNLETVLYLAGVDKVDGILMDIGVSSKQLDDPDRGFSYKYNTRLDMRMDKTLPISAYEVVNEYSEADLSRIIYTYGEERHARKLARYIVENRAQKPIETTGDLVGVIKKAIKGHPKKHPAKKTFQAIRIEVNKELEVLENVIEKAVSCLKPGGRLGIITFHSLEDRIVKNKFREMSKDCLCPSELLICMCDHKASIKLITKKPITPGEDELTYNKRAHSSKLRVLEKL